MGKFQWAIWILFQKKLSSPNKKQHKIVALLNITPSKDE